MLLPVLLRATPLLKRSAVWRTALLGSAALTAVAITPVASAQADPAATPITIANFAFAPGDTTVPVGGTVTWTNAQTGVPHTATALDGTWDSGVLDANGTFSFTFSQAGDFAYQCDIHPTMRGVIHVANEPAAASAPTQATSVDDPAAPAASPSY